MSSEQNEADNKPHVLKIEASKPIELSIKFDGSKQFIVVINFDIPQYSR